MYPHLPGSFVGRASTAAQLITDYGRAGRTGFIAPAFAFRHPWQMRWMVLALAFCVHPLNAEEDSASLEEVLVVGEHPGPGVVEGVEKVAHPLHPRNARTPAQRSCMALRGSGARHRAIERDIGRLFRFAARRPGARAAVQTRQAEGSPEATFAALPMHLLLGKEGVIARLRASGYAIEEPELLSR